MQLLERIDGAVRIRHHHRFSEFNHHVVRLQSMACHDLLNHRQQVGLPKLPRGQVYRDTQVGKSLEMPEVQLFADGIQDPPAYVNDEITRLRQGNEFIRRYPAMHGVLPACQCLKADNSSATDLDLRLVMHLQLAQLRRDAQVIFQLQTRHCEHGGSWHEELMPLPPLCLAS